MTENVPLNLRYGDYPEYRVEAAAESNLMKCEFDMPRQMIAGCTQKTKYLFENSCGEKSRTTTDNHGLVNGYTRTFGVRVG